MLRIASILAVIVIGLIAAPAAAARPLTGEAGQVATSTGAGGSPSACSDNNYRFLGGGAHWQSSLDWRFRRSSVPSSLNAGNTLDVIKKSFRNVVNSRNDCGMADQVGATQSYLGTTTRRPNVSANGACTTRDGHNVVGFGQLNGGFSGYTCIWWVGDEIVEADMRLDTNTPWALTLGSCSGELMMEALVTHEVGHAYGLGHVGETNHGRQTMSTFIDGLCENQEATLGRGDVLGLRDLY
ncbi:MAG TPA: matrixin family metalloprotease [Candidatus Limnocylindrales bacterium]|nr:matrixin family metalloprotease [Candidatus Limnocylindrales bacterium]